MSGLDGKVVLAYLLVLHYSHSNVVFENLPKDTDDLQQNAEVMLVQKLNSQTNGQTMMIDFHLLLEQINNHWNEPDI